MYNRFTCVLPATWNAYWHENFSLQYIKIFLKQKISVHVYQFNKYNLTLVMKILYCVITLVDSFLY